MGFIFYFLIFGSRWYRDLYLFLKYVENKFRSSCKIKCMLWAHLVWFCAFFLVYLWLFLRLGKGLNLMSFIYQPLLITVEALFDFFFNSWDLFSYVCVRTCANLWSFKLMFVIVSVPMICSPVAYILISLTAHAGTNKAASSSTSLNTRKLDEDTENLARKFLFFTSVFILYIVRIFFICYTVLG